jgi:hypothetical protein
MMHRFVSRRKDLEINSEIELTKHGLNKHENEFLRPSSN